MIEFLDQLDKQLFLLLNGLHHPVLDEIMVALSSRYYPIPIYVFFLFFLIWRFRVKSIWLILTIAAVVLIANHICSEMMKPFFERWRPCQGEALGEQVHLLIRCKGSYGFASSHASTTFGLVTILFLLFRDKFKYVVYLYIWAGLVSYSRIYVGVHYPGDIIVGAAIGVLIAILCYRLYIQADKKYGIGI